MIISFIYWVLIFFRRQHRRNKMIVAPTHILRNRQDKTQNFSEYKQSQPKLDFKLFKKEDRTPQGIFVGWSCKDYTILIVYRHTSADIFYTVLFKLKFTNHIKVIIYMHVGTYSQVLLYFSFCFHQALLGLFLMQITIFKFNQFINNTVYSVHCNETKQTKRNGAIHNTEQNNVPRKSTSHVHRNRTRKFTTVRERDSGLNSLAQRTPRADKWRLECGAFHTRQRKHFRK